MRQHLDLPRAWDGDLWHYANLGRTHAMHHHAELEFNLVISGEGLYLLGKRRYQIRPGDLLWLFPAQEHVLIGQTTDFEMWIGVVKPQAVRKIASDDQTEVLLQVDPEGEFCRRLNKEDTSQLENLFAEVVRGHDKPAYYNAGLAYALMQAWRLFERAPDVPNSDVHPAVEKAAQLIRTERSGLSLAELAGRVGLSSARLSRLFKEQTGVTLVAFRNRQRIESFLRLYGGGQRLKMFDAALQAGFGSYPQFHRVFRRIVGCSPRTYRSRQSTAPRLR
jgi:AraC-like DNA-binding protein